MKRTRNGILIPDVPIMAGGNLPNAVKGVSAGGNIKNHAVDLGLPSGTLWADCDIDVNMPDGFCATPYIYEKSFFSWGNIDGHNPVAESFEGVYDWGGVNAAAPWYDGQPYADTKGYTLNGNIPVGEEYDAARAILGDPWCMPLRDEYDELLHNCIFIDADGIEIPSATRNKLITMNGVVGFYLQSMINGARLFFAASGVGGASSWGFRGEGGYYWTRSFGSPKAHALSFDVGGVYWNYSYFRHQGQPIRAVHK